MLPLLPLSVGHVALARRPRQCSPASSEPRAHRGRLSRSPAPICLRVQLIHGVIDAAIAHGVLRCAVRPSLSDRRSSLGG